MLVAGCATPEAGQAVSATSEVAPTPTPPTVTESHELVSTSVPTSPGPEIDLQTSFAQLTSVYSADSIGVAVTGGQQTLLFGGWTSGAAWSTIKVPLSIAAMRADPDAARSSMVQAITQSDNAAAEQLWYQLGDAAAAANAVQGILAEGGNPTVLVQSQQVYPPYSPYGQTMWPLDQAAVFASNLPCLAGRDPASQAVLDQMYAVGQAWGMAQFGNAAKGGWGPDESGYYLVRQLAVVSNDTGTFGVSLAAKPSDGSFDTGVAMLDALASWVNDNRQQFPTGCQSP